MNVQSVSRDLQVSIQIVHVSMKMQSISKNMSSNLNAKNVHLKALEKYQIAFVTIDQVCIYVKCQ